MPSNPCRCSFIQDVNVQTLEGLAEEARRRRDAERSLEVAFLKRLLESPDRMGLQTGVEVHGTRRLEAELACERLSRRLDVARATGMPPLVREERNMFATIVSKRV